MEQDEAGAGSYVAALDAGLREARNLEREESLKRNAPNSRACSILESPEDPSHWASRDLNWYSLMSVKVGSGSPSQ